MTEKDELVTDVRAVRLRNGKFAGVFQSRLIGVRYVRCDKGIITCFETADNAETAAWRALARAIDEKQAPRSAKAKAFKVFGSGKTKRVELT